MPKLANIQILRAVAALLVVVYHTGIESTTICKNLELTCTYDMWAGGYGVGLFFIISGFIMVVTSWENFAFPAAPLDFMRRRIIRIVPLYWLVTTCAVIGVFFVPSMLNVPVLEPGYVAASYLFWPVERINGLVRPIANLGWTLNLEMMFYLVFALSLFLRRGLGLLLMTCFLVAFSAIQMTGVFGTSGVLSSTPLNFWGDPIILNFVVGMLSAVAYMRGFRVTGRQARLLLALSLVLAAVAYHYSGVILSHPENHLINRIASTPAFLFLFAAAAYGPQVDARLPVWRLGLLVGNASYSLYLVHPFFLRPLAKIWMKVVETHLPVWVFAGICPVIAVGVGIACYLMIEKPLLSYFSNRQPRHSPVLQSRGIA